MTHYEEIKQSKERVSEIIETVRVIRQLFKIMNSYTKRSSGKGRKLT